MTNFESETLSPVVSVTDELEITELFSPSHKLMVKSPKRVEAFQILRSSPRFAFWKIIYESGKPIPDLEGQYSSMEMALKHLKEYLATVKPTREAKSKQKYGDKPVPELKRKKVFSDGSSNEANSDN